METEIIVKDSASNLTVSINNKGNKSVVKLKTNLDKSEFAEIQN